MPDIMLTLLPPAVLQDPAKAAAELPRAVLMRTNFIPGIRQRLGWRGIRSCNSDPYALTMKICDCPGVFGMVLADVACRKSRGTAAFHLYYFPAPDEELLEAYSVAAGIEALRKDYLDRVREFPRHASCQLFQLGRLDLEYDPEFQSVDLSLTAAERQLVFSAEGIMVENSQGLVKEVVGSGGIDQDLAAWATIMPLFRTLAASFSFCLEAAPDRLQERRRRGRKFTCHGNGQMTADLLSDGSNERRLTLAWRAGGGREIDGGEFPTPDMDWQEPAEKPAAYVDEPWWSSRVPGAGHSLDKHRLGIVERPKLIVLTGFLGSGKTSYLQRFIEYQASRNAFVAVIQNEIGARGLDGRLLGQHYAVTEMDEGCVCCTLAGNLKLALGEILRSFQPDFIVLETTGLANPANFLSELSELEEHLEFCSVTAVVDAARGLEPLDKYPVARDQLVLADVILINQIDRAEQKCLNELRAWVQSINPTAQVFETIHGDHSPARLYGVNFEGRMKLPERPQSPKPTHSDQNISSLLVQLPGPLDRHKFLKEIANLPPQILRIKGILRFTDCQEAEVFQYVPGAQSLVIHRDTSPDQTFLVMIGEKIQQSSAFFLQALNLQAEG